MYYHKPMYGRAYLAFSKNLIDVSKEQVTAFRFCKTIQFGRREYALFSNGQTEIMQSLRALYYLRCKRGEQNINAKLTDAQGIEIFKRANSGEDATNLATEYNISRRTILAIKNKKARTHITMSYLRGVKSSKAIQACRENKNKKLSKSIASFDILSQNPCLVTNRLSTITHEAVIQLN